MRLAHRHRGPVRILLLVGLAIASPCAAQKDFADLIFSTTVWGNPVPALVNAPASPKDIIPIKSDLFPETIDPIPGLPSGVDVDGLCRKPDGNIVFSTDTWFTAPGGGKFGPGDLVNRDPRTGAFSMKVPSAALGLPVGANVDTISCVAEQVMFSVETPSVIANQPVAQNDILVFEPAEPIVVAMTGAEMGLAPNVDLTGFALAPDGGVMISTKTVTTIGTTVVKPGTIVQIGRLPEPELIFETKALPGRPPPYIDTFSLLTGGIFRDGIEEPIP